MSGDHELILRRTVIADERRDDDFTVYWDEISIGRIVRQPGIPAHHPDWAWSLIFEGTPQQAWMRGLAPDLDEAKQRFKLAWSAVRPTLTDDDIAGARQAEIYHAQQRARRSRR
ncbi:hypothetical protein BjapCC829_22060 [Bradyrhizobium barranii]|uniref:Uncharacterized protein n=1 Tax=Bradyrhizobium barranii TaxID=2992140 RepID=A0ABY3QYH8_9BRAD|nr:hypothetical protein [Bradyrhizobium japonicum]UFW91075.1 hypothetical protein BjapCC829_22060 [Bradyrhizobium japonicum]